MNLFVDYSSVTQTGIGEKSVPVIKKYNNDYDNTTCLYYKSHRIKKTDPITFDELTNNNAFKFANMWDPYTGKRSSDDPFGPLYFHPINLLQHIYQNRLKGLWIEESDEENGFYEGYYGEGVGAGEDFAIIGRGIYPERHIFRLPVPNCYLKKTHRMSLITMGPILTNREICEIDRLLTKYWSQHKFYTKIYKKIGSLYKLKCYYDIAISKSPLSMDLSGVDIGKKEDILKQSNPNMYLNRLAVEALKKMV